MAGDPVSGVALRNVHLRAPQTVDYVRPGSNVDLLFVAVNESAADGRPPGVHHLRRRHGGGDRRTRRVPPGGTLVVGTPDGQPSPLDATEGADTAEAASHADQADQQRPDLRLHVHVRAVRVRPPSQVPISAGEAPRREAPRAPAEADGSDTGGHR